MPPENRSAPAEAYVCVDVEAAGPHPSRYSLLSIGACMVAAPQRRPFYVELWPVNQNATPEAMAVCGLSMEELAERGLPPAQAMAQFATWLEAETPPERRPIFVALNAPFDWMFVADYFHRFLGKNPFGHSALDIKALFMGVTRTQWAKSSLHYIANRYQVELELTHHALRDAQDQAELFRRILAEAGRSP